ncbi:hypothetical protein ACFE04_021077 [Oxalis oulophora]
MGKRFFSCGSNELVTHLHRGCVELIYENFLLLNEANINNDAVQLLSREVVVARDDAIWCRKENEFFNDVTVEMAKLRNGIQEMINVINGKNGKNAGRVVRKGR